MDLQDAGSFSRIEKERNRPQLFMLDNFEIITSIYHGSWAFSAQMKGGFNELLSTRWKLPNYIVMVFSNDQIEELNVLGDEIYPILNTIFCNVCRGITSRKLQLPKKAMRAKPPTVIVVRTVTRPARMQDVNNFKFKRRTLNRAIQDTALKYNWKTINIQTILPGLNEQFNDKGDLSEEGFRAFWKYISQEIEMFEIRSKFRAQEEARQSKAETTGRYKTSHARDDNRKTSGIHTHQTKNF